MGKILFYPISNCFGHLNICLAISREIFKKYGDQHEIYMIVEKSCKDKLSKNYSKINFEIPKDDGENENNEEKFIRRIQEFGKIWMIKDKVELVKKNTSNLILRINSEKKNYERITEIIKRIKPDIVLCDQIITTPIGIDQGIPYAYIVSPAPTILGLSQLPPHQSGLPSEFNEQNINEWKTFMNQTYLSKEFKEVKKIQNSWLIEKNCQPVDSYYLLGMSPYFNVYNYPSAIDYFNEKVKLHGSWLKLESAVTLPLPPSFEVPEKLSKLEGKLIYVSMGSFSSVYKPLMERLVGIISQLPHRFILSAGIHLEELKFSQNIYAEKFTNQLSVLQTVDIIIFHGGNNTLTECFYFGVPQIILPLFGDQINNATKIKEKGLGETFPAFECTKEDLSDAIDKLTTKEMKQKYKEISYKIQQDKSIDKICEKILSYCK